jgi:transposase
MPFKIILWALNERSLEIRILMNNTAKLNPVNFKLMGANRFQYEFQTSCIDNLIPEDHKARIVWDFVSEMDLSVCLQDILSFYGQSGRPCVDPKILLTLWLYSIMDGNISARKLEELCKNHNVYKWICGGASVNRTTLAEFRSLNSRKFDELLIQCLAVMVKNELIADSDFAQDGTRVKGNAGFASFHRENTLQTTEKQLSNYIDQLKKEEKSTPDIYEKRKLFKKEKTITEKRDRVKAALRSLDEARCQKIENCKQRREKVTEEDIANVRASTTDPEIRKMKMNYGGFRLAYNVQFATGLDSRVIYAVDVVNTLDPGTAPRLMAQVQNFLGRLKLGEIKNWIADSAYSAKNDLIIVSQLFPNCTYYAPPKTKKGINPKKCVKGDCEAIKKWREMIGSEEVNEIYRKRCSTAEFSNMQVKNRGLKEFAVRGLVKVLGMARLHAIAQNIERSIDLISKKLKSLKA